MFEYYSSVKHVEFEGQCRIPAISTKQEKKTVMLKSKDIYEGLKSG